MSQAEGGRGDGWQCAEDLAACAYRLLWIWAPDAASVRRVQGRLLRAQAQLLRAALGFVERRLARLEPHGASHPAEKIEIE